MNARNDVRPGEGEQVIISFQRDGVVFEYISPEVLFLQSMPLYHGAHGSINNKNALI